MPSRPNVLFILTDQQRHDTIAALGHPHCITPHLDKLVEEGVSFTQCHVTAPSRASLSGKPLHRSLPPHYRDPQECRQLDSKLD